MKIFYFSGTGNSESVARKLGAGGECINIAACENGSFEDEEIGFVFPVYCGGLPDIVRGFIEASSFSARYIWAVATCGGSEGDSLKETDFLLRQKGFKLDYGASIVLPDNCIIFKTSPEKREKLLTYEDDRVKALRVDIDGRVINFKGGKVHFFARKVMWGAMNTVYGLNKKTASDKCVACGKCADLCPCGNIEIKSGKAVFGSNCTQCFSCIHRCPVHAISFGRLRVDDKTAYVHPLPEKPNN